MSDDARALLAAVRDLAGRLLLLAAVKTLSDEALGEFVDDLLTHTTPKEAR